MKKYLFWEQELEIQKNMNGIIVMNMSPNQHINIIAEDSSKYKKTFALNKIAYEIITLINGARTMDDIITYLASKYDEKPESIELKIETFINTIATEYGLNLDFQERPLKRNINIKQSNSIYPKVASIEITERCNIECLHCYGDYHKNSTDVMGLERAKKLIRELKALDISILELTGGEITTHPKFKEILLYAISLEFPQIALLTNGIALNEDIMQIIIKNQPRVVVQIDLHSLNDEYLEWFTNKGNTLNRIKKNIVYLSNNDARMRVATIVTPKNLKEIEAIADWVHNIGVRSYGVTPVIRMGRAVNDDYGLMLSQLEDYEELEAILTKLKNKYTDFISLIKDGRPDNNNCGCITSHIVISANGDIKLCTMDNKEYLNTSIGNVFEKDLRNIYDENHELLTEIFNTTAPKFNSRECESCEYKYFCSDCLLRGFIMSIEMKDSCKWFNERIPKKFKEKLMC